MSENVDFGRTKLLGFLGLVAGTAMGIGVPWVVLSHAQAAGLGSVASTFLCLAGIVGGVAMATVSIFFSIVIPQRVGR